MNQLTAQLKTSLTYLFVPHKSNNYRAKILHGQSVLLMVLGVLIFNTGSRLINTKLDILGYAANISPQEVIRLTNEKRATEDLSTLVESEALDRAAYAKGKHMLENDYWAHVAPDGTEPWYFFNQEGYKYKYAGENLARDFTNPGSAVDAWMASTTHRENLMSPKYKEIGIAVVEGDLNGVDTTIIVQLFGTSAVDTPSNVVPVAAAQDTSTTSLVEEVQAETTQLVYVAGVSENSSKVSPFWLSKNSSLILIGLFMAVFIIDSLVVAYNNTSRVSGRQFIHISFLGMIFIVLLISQSGRIF